MAEVVTQSPDEMRRRWSIMNAIVRWVRMREDRGMPADPRNTDWLATAEAELTKLQEVPEWAMRRVIVLKAMAKWIALVEAGHGSPFEFDRFGIEAKHSALLFWLFHGNEPQEHPPPLRMSRPDHLMIAIGKVNAFEVWTKMDGDKVVAVVDQHSRGWKYIDGYSDEGRFTFGSKHWGTWRFVRVVRQRTSHTGKTYETVSWDGERIS